MTRMRMYRGATIVMIATIILIGCTDIPACEGHYSSKGDEQAIYEIVDEFQKAIHEASRRNNTVLLAQARSIRESKDFLRMEEFSCRVQKEYGRF